MLASILQASFDQVDAQAASPELRRDFGVGEDDDIPRQHVIEPPQVSVNGELETIFFRVVGDLNIFGSHKVFFRGSLRIFDKRYPICYKFNIFPLLREWLGKKADRQCSSHCNKNQ
jgi:hypothetical protein